MPVAVVTGGASGMGRSICQYLARKGHAVVVADINGDSADHLAKEIAADGGRAAGCRTDVANRADVDRAVDLARDEFGPVEILVTSAGVTNVEPFSTMTLESWNRVIGINLTGTFHCAQAVLPEMVDAGWGRIVFISASSAQRGAPRMAHYASSKGGVIALTKTLALEYAKTGVTVNNIAPSAIESPMVEQVRASAGVASPEEMARNVPVGRMGTGDDIAAACMFLCSPEASYTTGQTISVNGGSFIG